MAIFFLFTREITRFVQFIVLAVAIVFAFYAPRIVRILATGMANAFGVHRSRSDRKSACPGDLLPTYTNIRRAENEDLQAL